MKTHYVNECSRAMVVPAKIEGAPGLMELTRLWTTPDMRKRGYATKLMQEICAAANRDGVVLVLRPEPYGIEGLADLMGWYERFGFSKLQDGPVLMARAPVVLQIHSLAGAASEVCRA